jgi:predicted DNA-binding transcriptional regulator AlpA
MRPKAAKQIAPTLLRKSEVARHLNVSFWTIDRWVRNGQFLRPIRLTPNSPDCWRIRDIEAFIDKRKSARKVRRKPRGRLKWQQAQAAPECTP